MVRPRSFRSLSIIVSHVGICPPLSFFTILLASSIACLAGVSLSKRITWPNQQYQQRGIPGKTQPVCAAGNDVWANDNQTKTQVIQIKSLHRHTREINNNESLRRIAQKVRKCENDSGGGGTGNNKIKNRIENNKAKASKYKIKKQRPADTEKDKRTSRITVDIGKRVEGGTAGPKTIKLSTTITRSEQNKETTDKKHTSKN